MAHPINFHDTAVVDNITVRLTTYKTCKCLEFYLKLSAAELRLYSVLENYQVWFECKVIKLILRRVFVLLFG